MVNIAFPMRYPLPTGRIESTLKFCCYVLLGLQFNDEDDLTRKFNVDKEYNVFVKMDKKVPGIQ